MYKQLLTPGTTNKCSRDTIIPRNTKCSDISTVETIFSFIPPQRLEITFHTFGKRIKLVMDVMSQNLGTIIQIRLCNVRLLMCSFSKYLSFIILTSLGKTKEKITQESKEDGWLFHYDTITAPLILPSHVHAIAIIGQLLKLGHCSSPHHTMFIFL